MVVTQPRRLMAIHQALQVNCDGLCLESNLGFGSVLAAIRSMQTGGLYLDRNLSKSYFEAFTARWPTVSDLAAASLDDVLTAWAGLGYYARARNLHKCAVEIAERRQGQFPRDEADLLTLPGVGAYTAAAIAAITDLPLLSPPAWSAWAALFWAATRRRRGRAWLRAIAPAPLPRRSPSPSSRSVASERSARVQNRSFDRVLPRLAVSSQDAIAGLTSPEGPPTKRPGSMDAPVGDTAPGAARASARHGHRRQPTARLGAWPTSSSPLVRRRPPAASARRSRRPCPST